RSLRDWSSDVCSSDLCWYLLGEHLWRYQHRRDQRTEPRMSCLADALHNCLLCFGVGASPGVPHTYLDKKTLTIASAPSWRDSHRSEERRVGKEGIARL